MVVTWQDVVAVLFETRGDYFGDIYLYDIYIVQKHTKTAVTFVKAVIFDGLSIYVDIRLIVC